MTSTTGILPTIDQNLTVRLFGKKVDDLSVVPGQYKSGLTAQYGKPVRFAMIHGVRALGNCEKLPRPLLMLVPDNDIDPDGCGNFGDPDEFRMWVLPNESPIATFDVETMKVEELRSAHPLPRLFINSDFHIHDVHFNILRHQISGMLRAYFNVRQPGPFGDLLNVTVIDVDDHFSISLNPGSNACVQVIGAGPVSVEVCFRTDPTRVCGTAHVSVNLPIVGDIHKDFDIACVPIHVAENAELPAPSR